MSFIILLVIPFFFSIYFSLSLGTVMDRDSPENKELALQLMKRLNDRKDNIMEAEVLELIEQGASVLTEDEVSLHLLAHSCSFYPLPCVWGWGVVHINSAEPSSIIALLFVW
jgi:hypothetical protein